MDLMEIFVKLGINSDDFNKGMSDAENKASTFGQVFKANIASQAVVKGFSMLASGAKAGASAIANITKQAVEGYSTQEQMVGGVEKLYGNAAKQVIKYANDAYKTSGMSANEYMDTATQFSASLIQSLGGNTKKAAEQTDVAMRAISDNVNVFGSNMEDVTNAFKGFSKQNYTMLDNLKLGYGGTKQEMERLIKDANEWGKANGEASNLSIDSFSDVVTAIQQIQEKQHIAGTTAKEAATTIEGSVNMAKQAWENLKTGIGDPKADLDQLIDNFVDSAQHVVSNVMPILEKALKGIGELVEKVAPIISKKLPGLINTILPPLIDAVTSLITALAKALPQILDVVIPAVKQVFPVIVKAVVDALPDIIEAVTELISDVASALPEIIDVIVDKMPDIAKAVMDGFTSAFKDASPAGKVMLAGIVANMVGGGITDGIGKIKSAKDTIKTITSLFSGNKEDSAAADDSFIAKAFQPSKFDGIAEKLSGASAKISGAFSSIGSTITGTVIPAISSLLTSPAMPWILGIAAAITGIIIVVKNWGAISDWISDKWQKVTGVIENVASGLGDFLSGVWDGISSTVENVWNGITGFLSGIWQGISDTATSIWQGISDFITNLWTGFTETISNIWNGIVSIASTVWTAITDTITSIWNGFYSVFGPLIEAFKYLFETIFQAIGIIVQNVMQTISNVIQTVWNAIVGFITPILETIKNAIQTAWTAIQTVVTTVMSAIQAVITAIWTVISSVISTVMSTITNVISTAWNGIKTVVSTVLSAIQAVITVVWGAISSVISSVMSTISSVISNVWNGIRNTVSSILSGIASVVSNIWNGIRNTVSNVMSSIAGTVSNIWNNVKNGIANTVGGIAGTIRNGFEGAISYVKGLGSQAFKWGADIINGIINGIKSGIQKLASAVTGVADNIRSKLHFSEPDEGPLKGFHTWAPDMMRTYAKGMTDNLRYVDSATQDVAGTIQNGFDSIDGGNINDTLNTALNGLKTGMEDGVQEVQGTMTGSDQKAGLITTLQNQMQGVMDLLNQYFPQMANQQIVLDTGTLVGQTASAMDRQLGTFARRASR